MDKGKFESKEMNVSDKYKKLMFIPVILICVSLYVIGYNVVYEKVKTKEPEMMVLAENQQQNEENANIEDETENIDDYKYLIENPIDINSATVEELMQLPDIGEKRAQEIINSRKEMNGFRSADEVIYVQGIGSVVFESIRKYIIALPYEGEK